MYHPGIEAGWGVRAGWGRSYWADTSSQWEMKVVPLIMMSVGTEQVHGSQRNQTVGSAGNRAGSVHVQGKGPFTHREERRIFLQKIRQQREQRIHLPCGRLGFDPWVGRSPGEGKGHPLQYSGLENSKDCIVHGVTKSWIWLSDFHFTFFTLTWKKWYLTVITWRLGLHSRPLRLSCMGWKLWLYNQGVPKLSWVMRKVIQSVLSCSKSWVTRTHACTHTHV